MARASSRPSSPPASNKVAADDDDDNDDFYAPGGTPRPGASDSRSVTTAGSAGQLPFNSAATPPPYVTEAPGEDALLLGDAGGEYARKLRVRRGLRRLLYACVLLVVVVVPVVLYFFVPRAPILTYVTSRLVEFDLRDQELVLSDEWTVNNRNYIGITMTSFVYRIYYGDALVGTGSSERSYDFAARSEGPFNATKVVGSSEAPVFQEIVAECEAVGSFTLETKFESVWQIMVSRQYLTSVNTQLYTCDGPRAAPVKLAR